MAQNLNPYCVPGISGTAGSFRVLPEMRGVKLIGVEEHAHFPDLFKDVSVDNHATAVLGSRMKMLGGKTGQSSTGTRLADVGEGRIKDMDEHGVAVQILSLSNAINSSHLVGDDAPTGVALARNINDELKRAVDANPTRFRAFAELPMQVPEEAVKELRRCVTEMGFVGAMLSGSVGGEGKFLDGPEFDTLLSTFEELDVPLFLHPGVPAKAVWDVYYDLKDRPTLSTLFGLGGWGWHNEVAIHVLRLVLSGTLDRHPRLKIIVGHLGEMMPSMMDRLEQVFNPANTGLQRSPGETLRAQVWISVSGFFALAPTQAAIATWGVDRVLFAVDYPFMNIARIGEYLRGLGSLIAPSDMRKICQTNAEELLKIKA